MDKTFENFLKKKKQVKPSRQAIDWKKEKQEWLEHLQKLYKLFKTVLGEYAANGYVEIKTDEVVCITEDFIGTYDAPVMRIMMGNEEIVLTPVGTNLIGAKGRVDIEGKGGSAKLLLVDSATERPGDLIRTTITAGEQGSQEEEFPDENVSWEWKLLSEPPDRRFLLITDESIVMLLMDIASSE